MPDVIALSLIADLAFSVQVEETANRLGFRVATVSSPQKAINALGQGRASLFVMDLAAAGDRAGEVMRAARTAPYPVAVLAFGSGAALENIEADLAVSPSAFSQNMGHYLIACLDKHRESQTRPERDP